MHYPQYLLWFLNCWKWYCMLWYVSSRAVILFLSYERVRSEVEGDAETAMSCPTHVCICMCLCMYVDVYRN